MNFTPAQLEQAKVFFEGLGRKRDTVENYLVQILRWDVVLVKNLLDEIVKGSVTARLEVEAVALDLFPQIPAIFKQFPNWVTYKSVEEKAPIVSGTYQLAKSNDPSTWVPYQVLCENIQAGHGYQGVGFVPDGENSQFLTAIDIDNSVNRETGAVADWAKRIIDSLGPTYVEKTVSGTGLRAWVIIRSPLHEDFPLGEGGKANQIKKSAQIEVVNDSQYMTFSRDVLPQSVNSVRELNDGEAAAFFRLIADLQGQYGASSQAAVTAAAGATAGDKPFYEKTVYPRNADGLIPSGYRHKATLSELGRMHENKEFMDFDSRYQAITEWREQNLESPTSEAQDLKVRAAVEGSLNWRPSGKLRMSGQKPDPEIQARWLAEQASREEERAADFLAEWLEFTDIQNSKKFVEENTEFVRAQYGGSKGRTNWYVWDGTRWKEDLNGDVIGLAKKTAVEQLETSIGSLTEATRGGDQEEVKVWTKRCKAAKECCSDYRIHSMLNLAASGTSLSVQMTQLDGQPHLINFLNGTFDTTTMELRPHRKEDLLTQVIPINYNPNAKAPKWEAFVERIFRDKPYMWTYLQRVVGYMLKGDNPEQVFFLFYGIPGGGKTTLGRVLQALLGEYSRTVPSGMFLGRGKVNPDAPSPAHADLYGSRLAISEELDEDATLNSGEVKKVTGGGKVKARRLYGSPFDYVPGYKLLFLTNHTPRIEDFSGGVDDRIRVVRMEQRLRHTQEEVKDFYGVLIKEELEGILAWAIRGLMDVKKNGLQDPSEVQLMTKQFMGEENVVTEWLEERCVQTPNGFVSSSEAHRDFIQWAKNHGEDTRQMTPRWFGLRMAHAGWKPEQATRSGSTIRGFTGLKLKPQPGVLVMSGVESEAVGEVVSR